MTATSPFPVKIVPDELQFDAFNISQATIFVKNNLEVAISVEIYAYIDSYDSIITESILPGTFTYFHVKMDPSTSDSHIQTILLDVSTESHAVCKKKLAVKFIETSYPDSNNEIELEPKKTEKEPLVPGKEYHSAKFNCSQCGTDSCFNTVHTHAVLADHL